jgi:hypothetical protein
MSCIATASIGDKSRSRLFADAGADEIAPLQASDFLVNGLFQAVQASLGHTQLHLVLPLLALCGLRGGATGVAFAR